MTTIHLFIVVFFSTSIAFMLYNLYRQTRIHKLYRIISKDADKSVFTNQTVYTVTARFKRQIKTVHVSESTFEQLNINQEILF